MAGIGGLTQGQRDLSRRRDRQAAWVLAAAGAICLLFFALLALALGAVAALYAYAIGAGRACVAGCIVVALACLGLILGFGDGWAGGFAT
jgi:hypothetical protein